jgi:hypothetical protein
LRNRQPGGPHGEDLVRPERPRHEQGEARGQGERQEREQDSDGQAWAVWRFGLDALS